MTPPPGGPGPGVAPTERVYRATHGEENYQVELAETRLCFSRDTGTRESYGGNAMPYARFLRSAKWQAHVSEIFGERVLQDLLAAARDRVGQPD